MGCAQREKTLQREDNMKGKFSFKLGALCAILSAMLLMPVLGQAKEKGAAGYKAQKAQILKDLKLAPEKEKAILAVDDKYAAERKEIIAGVKQANEDLQAALAAPNPDEAKLKELVSALTTGQDKIFASYKNQRDEELSLMTPAEQAKYLIILGQWREKMMEKRKQKAAGKQK
jgi:Spy/CpxP family protein refolding chaperone